MSDPLPYTRETPFPRLLEVKNYLCNYLAMYTGLTRVRMRVKLVSPTYWGLRII